MERPVFELGMMFRSSQIFGQAVMTYAILQRRFIQLVKNFGKKVKYICEYPCEWIVYAPPMRKTIKYQIKIIVNKHICMLTFQQKQINSTWLAEHYEKEIRMHRHV